MYQVSDLGRIKSLERYVKKSSGHLRINKERILKQSISGSGYLIISLCNGSKIITRTIHQLVTEAFLKHKPCRFKLVVNHKNHIRIDNRLFNLEIITTRENTNLKHLNSSSKYVGVSWHKHQKQWQSRIVIKNKKIHLGYFSSEIDASNAYQNKLKNYLENENKDTNR